VLPGVAGGIPSKKMNRNNFDGMDQISINGEKLTNINTAKYGL